MDHQHLERVRQLTQAAELEETTDVFSSVDLTEAFGDLQVMLFQGFVTSPMDIGAGSVRVILKSLSPAEVRMADLYAEGVDGDNFQRRNLYLIASSIFLLNGANVLSKRERVFEDLVSTFASLRPEMLTLIFMRIVQLAERSRACISQVEGFFAHPLSRQRWLAYQGQQLNQSSVTGISGTELLGLNQCQEVWIALNRIEDRRLVQESEWDNAKFVASTWSKDVKRIDSRDRSRRKSLHQQRQYEFLKAAGIDVGSVGQKVRVSAESTEELLDQLNRSLSGQKDLHDLIVEKHERAMRESYERQQEELRALRAQHTDYGGFLHQTIEVFEPHEIDSHLATLRNRQRQNLREGPQAGQLTGRKRLEMLERLTPPKLLQQPSSLADSLTVRMSPDESADYVRAEGVDHPIRGDD